MNTFKNILLVIEPHTDEQIGLNQALTLVDPNNAKITIAAVVENTNNASRLSDTINEKQAKLASYAKGIEAHDVSIEIRVLVGRAFSEIILDVINNERDLVIKPVEPRKPGYKLFAGTDIKLLRKCPCPVLLVRQNISSRFQTVVAAVDVDSLNPENDLLSGQILALANSVATRNSSQYHIVHAWQIDNEDYLRSSRTGLSYPELEQLRNNERAHRKAKITKWADNHASDNLTNGQLNSPQLCLRNGPARNEIPGFLRDVNADLIVMGTVARTGIPGFFIGNTAEEILNQVSCSVFALKPAGFVSPVATKQTSPQPAKLRSVI